MSKIRIAHLAGPTATIQNTPPLVTSSKARAKAGLPPLTAGKGNPSAFDPLRAQGLCRAVLGPSARSRRRRSLQRARRLCRLRRRLLDGEEERHGQARLRDRAQAGGRALSVAVHGAAEGWQSLGGGNGRAVFERHPARLLPRRLAQLRGDRPALDRRRRQGQPHRRPLRSKAAPKSSSTASRLPAASPGAWHTTNGRTRARGIRRPSGSATTSSPTSPIISPRRRRAPCSPRSPTTCRRS